MIKKDKLISMARKYRSEVLDEKDPLYASSVVIIRNGEVVGLNYLMYEAFFEHPGTICVNADDHVFLAVGRAACVAENSNDCQLKNSEDCLIGAQNWIMIK